MVAMRCCQREESTVGCGEIFILVSDVVHTNETQKRIVNLLYSGDCVSTVKVKAPFKLVCERMWICKA